MEHELFERTRKALKNSWSPYSHFQVGAGLLCRSGEIFTGVNIENASYGATVCAERVAIWKAVSEGFKELDSIIVMTDTKIPTPPCALCLQVMAEFCAPDFKIHLSNLCEIKKTYNFCDLLTHPFGPSYLLGE